MERFDAQPRVPEAGPRRERMKTEREVGRGPEGARLQASAGPGGGGSFLGGARTRWWPGAVCETEGLGACCSARPSARARLAGWFSAGRLWSALRVPGSEASGRLSSDRGFQGEGLNLRGRLGSRGLEGQPSDSEEKLQGEARAAGLGRRRWVAAESARQSTPDPVPALTMGPAAPCGQPSSVRPALGRSGPPQGWGPPARSGRCAHRQTPLAGAAGAGGARLGPPSVCPASGPQSRLRTCARACRWNFPH